MNKTAERGPLLLTGVGHGLRKDIKRRNARGPDQERSGGPRSFRVPLFVASVHIVIVIDAAVRRDWCGRGAVGDGIALRQVVVVCCEVPLLVCGARGLLHGTASSSSSCIGTALLLFVTRATSTTMQRKGDRRGADVIEQHV